MGTPKPTGSNTDRHAPTAPHAKEMIILGSIDIEHPQPLEHPFTIGVAEDGLHSVLDPFVLLAIGGNHSLRGGNRAWPIARG